MILRAGSVSVAALRERLPAASGATVTYREVGASDAGSLPAGYREVEDVRVVGAGEGALRRLGAALNGWDLHRAAGMALAADGDAERGVTVLNAARIGPASVVVPCRVVLVVDDPGRRGFAYGSLPGHPLVGEERFTAELGADGLVRLRIRSFSRPVGLAALAPAVARAGQTIVNARYLGAAARLAA